LFMGVSLPSFDASVARFPLFSFTPAKLGIHVVTDVKKEGKKERRKERGRLLLSYSSADRSCLSCSRRRHALHIKSTIPED
jgi:hypothetical protein